MSAINIWLTESRAVVGVDTECRFSRNATAFDSSKIAAFPHANLVVAARGSTLGFASILSAMYQSADIIDFDSVLDLMPHLLAQTAKAIETMIAPQLRAKMVDLQAIYEQELVIVGWSARANRMRAVYYSKRGEGAQFEEQEILEPGHISPCDDGFEMPDVDLATAAGHVGLLSAQVDYVRKVVGPHAPIGGRLVMVDMTPSVVTMSTHQLPRRKARTMAEMVISERPALGCPE